MLEASQLLRPHDERRTTGWAKAACKADPNLVFQLSELPTGVVKDQVVLAATMVVPHTCGAIATGASVGEDIAGEAEGGDGEDAVRALPTSVTHTCLGTTFPNPNPNPKQVEDTNSSVTYPSSAAGLDPSSRRGLTGPQLADMLQVKYDTSGGKRCAIARAGPAHQPVPLRKSQPIPLAFRRSVVYAAQIVSPPLAAPESNLGDRSISSGT